jgi:hypothetical protein
MTTPYVDVEIWSNKRRKLHNYKLQNLYYFRRMLLGWLNQKIWDRHANNRRDNENFFSKYRSKDLKRRCKLQDQAVNGTKILTWILQKQGMRAWTVLNWLGIGFNGRPSWTLWWTFGLRKCSKYLDQMSNFKENSVPWDLLIWGQPYVICPEITRYDNILIYSILIYSLKYNVVTSLAVGSWPSWSGKSLSCLEQEIWPATSRTSELTYWRIY